MILILITFFRKKMYLRLKKVINIFVILYFNFNFHKFLENYCCVNCSLMLVIDFFGFCPGSEGFLELFLVDEVTFKLDSFDEECEPSVLGEFFDPLIN